MAALHNQYAQMNRADWQISSLRHGVIRRPTAACDAALTGAGVLAWGMHDNGP